MTGLQGGTACIVRSRVRCAPLQPPCLPVCTVRADVLRSCLRHPICGVRRRASLQHLRWR